MVACAGDFLRKSPEIDAIARKVHFHPLLCLAEASRLGHPFRKRRLESDCEGSERQPLCIQEQ